MNREQTSPGTQASGTKAAGKPETSAKCFSCGIDSRSRPLLSCLHQGEPKWVCVRCLPMLIHGSE